MLLTKYLPDIFEELVKETGVNAIYCTESIFDFLIGGFGRLIVSEASYVISESGKHAPFASLALAINDLGWALKGYVRKARVRGNA